MATLQHPLTGPDGPASPASRGAAAGATTAAPRRSARRPAARSAPRFAGDWVSATLRLDAHRRIVRLNTGEVEWLLEAEDFDAVSEAVRGRVLADVEWSPDLRRLLVPGAHERAGTSFFRLRPTGSA
ncbi:hypothetical protein ACQ3I4_10810 [Zafaria sp. Z1313]|uniref:hypothetical protein n=1 Tax=unclassified Zafaria TaxID=2828765 RepID=UPI002E7845C5|nr:hypothetical protein [Zafaria sp. J156]MEE1622238.1 hypothetical protein [Zafaria sp. J156]